LLLQEQIKDVIIIMIESRKAYEAWYASEKETMFRAVDEVVGDGREIVLFMMMMMSFICSLVLDSVTSTPQWIRQPKRRCCVFGVCV
jgi:hypothetical protein